MRPLSPRARISSIRPVPTVLIEKRKRNAILLLAVVQNLARGKSADGRVADGASRVLIKRDSGAPRSTLRPLLPAPVYSLVLRISQQPASAEEIVQDVFLQLWRNAKRYQAARGPLEPWLFTVGAESGPRFPAPETREAAPPRRFGRFDLPPSAVVRPDP